MLYFDTHITFSPRRHGKCVGSGQPETQGEHHDRGQPKKEHRFPSKHVASVTQRVAADEPSQRERARHVSRIKTLGQYGSTTGRGVQREQSVIGDGDRSTDPWHSIGALLLNFVREARLLFRAEPPSQPESRFRGQTTQS